MFLGTHSICGGWRTKLNGKPFSTNVIFMRWDTSRFCCWVWENSTENQTIKPTWFFGIWACHEWKRLPELQHGDSNSYNGVHASFSHGIIIIRVADSATWKFALKIESPACAAALCWGSCRSFEEIHRSNGPIGAFLQRSLWKSTRWSDRSGQSEFASEVLPECQPEAFYDPSNTMAVQGLCLALFWIYAQ